jgi:hypothetical protein
MSRCAPRGHCSKAARLAGGFTVSRVAYLTRPANCPLPWWLSAALRPALTISRIAARRPLPAAVLLPGGRPVPRCAPALHRAGKSGRQISRFDRSRRRGQDRCGARDFPARLPLRTVQASAARRSRSPRGRAPPGEEKFLELNWIRYAGRGVARQRKDASPSPCRRNRLPTRLRRCRARSGERCGRGRCAGA